MAELTEVQALTMAANINADTVREQAEVIKQQALRIAELRAALSGEIGLVQLIASADRKPDVILKNHRHVRALEVLGSKHA